MGENGLELNKQGDSSATNAVGFLLILMKPSIKLKSFV
jgi:hypothetical protein